MKRFTLSSFIMLMAILVCFFSSTVFAGEGDNSNGSGSGDTNPWDMDGIANDSSSVLAGYSYQSSGSEGAGEKLSLTFSLSSRCTLWLYSRGISLPEQKQVEAIKTDLNSRGNYRTSKLIN